MTLKAALKRPKNFKAAPSPFPTVGDVAKETVRKYASSKSAGTVKANLQKPSKRPTKRGKIRVVMANKEQALAIAERVMAIHDKTLRKLAE
jgi:hypothetical protein